MDNTKVNVTAQLNLENVTRALSLAAKSSTAYVGWCVDPEDPNAIILFWAVDGDATNGRGEVHKFMGTEHDMVFGAVFSWLNRAMEGNVPQPDIDGSIGRAFTVQQNEWGSIEGFGYGAVCRVSRAWALYGK